MDQNGGVNMVQKRSERDKSGTNKGQTRDNRDKTGTNMAIKINAYPPEAKNLVDIWTKYSNSSMPEIGVNFITFTNRRPKRPKSNNRSIAGLKAESIAYLKDDTELVKMSVENFIYLMAKCGVDIEVKEIKEAE